MFSIARKLGTIEERRRDQKYLFRREDYRSQDRNCLGSGPGVFFLA